MFRSVAEFLRSNGWRDWQVVQRRTSTKILWQIYGAESKYPSVVAKRYMSGYAADGGETAKVLQHLEPFSCSLGIPQLLHSTVLPDGGFLLIETGRPGVSFCDELPIDDLEIGRQFGIVEPWIRRFQASLSGHGSLADAIGSSIQACRRNIPEISQEEAELMSFAERTSAQFVNVPAFPVHGDFWGLNVLQYGGDISVIDWDTFHYGAPLEDEYQFAIGAVLKRDSCAEELIWQAFWGDCRLAYLLKSVTQASLTRLGLPAKMLGPLFILFVINRLRFTAFRAHLSWRNFAVRYARAGFPLPFQALC